MALVAGVDSSTQSCTVVIRDADSGELVRSGRAPHPPGTEVDPAGWWEALQAALELSGVADLGRPTLNPGETVADLRADRSAFEDYDADKEAERGYGYARLAQLALEHVMGAR